MQIKIRIGIAALGALCAGLALAAPNAAAQAADSLRAQSVAASHTARPGPPVSRTQAARIPFRRLHGESLPGVPCSDPAPDHPGAGRTASQVVGLEGQPAGDLPLRSTGAPDLGKPWDGPAEAGGGVRMPTATVFGATVRPSLGLSPRGASVSVTARYTSVVTPRMALASTVRLGTRVTVGRPPVWSVGASVGFPSAPA